jgi:very-short-patch-repair endonuclease
MENPKDSLVTGRKPVEKQERARQLRREMTPMERKLWYHLRGSRLDGLHFRRQLVADGFIVDFYCHAAGLVVEVDGGIHQTQAEYDAERDAIIRERNLSILRVTNAEVETACPDTLARIRQIAQFRLKK